MIYMYMLDKLNYHYQFQQMQKGFFIKQVSFTKLSESNPPTHSLGFYQWGVANFLKTFSSVFSSGIGSWYTDQNSKPIETEGRLNLTNVIYP